MSRVERSALINYSALQMYLLVNDIESYPDFMPGCKGAKILQKGDGWLEARLDLSRGGFKHSIVTKNIMDEGVSISMDLVSGPFKQFNGVWLFTELEKSACKVSFSLEYSFINKMMDSLLSKLFESVAGDQVTSLCARAKHVYG